MFHAGKTLKSGCGLGTRLNYAVSIFQNVATMLHANTNDKYTITVVMQYTVVVLSLSFSICLHTCFTTFLCFVLIYWCVSEYNAGCNINNNIIISEYEFTQHIC